MLENRMVVEYERKYMTSDEYEEYLENLFEKDDEKYEEERLSE